MKKILFVCSQNKLRSPTAEKIFSAHPDIQTASAGLDSDAAIRLTPELVEWADIIFVMEKSHRNKLHKKFGKYLGRQKVICLDIPDEYEYMDAELIRLLQLKVMHLLK